MQNVRSLIQTTVPAVYILFAFVFFSCKQKNDYSAEINRLENSASVLHKAKIILLSADTTVLKNKRDTSFKKLVFIMEKLANDTVKKNLALFLSRTYEQCDNISNFLENRRYFEKAINEALKRIDDLKHDLSNDLFENNTMPSEYVNNEISAAEKIFAATERATEKAGTSFQKLDSLQSRIFSLADSLTNLAR